MNTVIDAKIGNLNELTKVLSIKGQAQEQLHVSAKMQPEDSSYM